MPKEPLVSSVSDTARWVAAYRAQESLRPDALFNDPFADRLAGEQGRAIAAKGPRQTRDGWAMVVRTRVIDDLILECVREGCDRVVNLAAGLDTRPYRMSLPESLDWVEVDLGPMIDEKEKLLAGEKPRCHLRREQVDLTNERARVDFLSRATSGAAKVLVLTEGLLVYLDDDIVAAIGRDLLARPAVRWWVLDVTSPAVRQMLMKGMGSVLDGAPMKFAPPDGVAFFEKLGWKARDIRSFFREALRLRRLPVFLRMFALFSEPDPRNLGDHGRWSAVLRLEP